MKKTLKKIGLVMLCISLSCGAFAQSEDMDKLFGKYDNKHHTRKYKKFNQDIRKSMENFNIVFELNESDYLLKVSASEKDGKGCSNFVVVTRLGDKERVIWLYGKTNLKKFIDYVRDALM